MAHIKIISECPLYDGMPVTFKAPCDCTAVEGIKVYYGEDSQTFGFRDAHGNNLAGIGNLFARGAYVKALLNTAEGAAYIQNADTNAYLEGKITPAFAVVTMSASGWAGNTYSFEVAYPSAQCNISIEVAPTATVEQFEAFGEAMICGSADSNVATALNGAPTVDIPIIVKVVAK